MMVQLVCCYNAVSRSIQREYLDRFQRAHNLQTHALVFLCSAIVYECALLLYRKVFRAMNTHITISAVNSAQIVGCFVCLTRLLLVDERAAVDD